MLFLLLPLLSLARLTQPISTAYKLAIAWGGLRGALTLVLALAVTENPGAAARGAPVRRGAGDRPRALHPAGQRHDLAGGHPLLGLDRLSPIDRLLRDRVLEALLCRDERDDRQGRGGRTICRPRPPPRALAPYEAWTKAAARRRCGGENGLTERERLTVALVALGNQERTLVLETLARAGRLAQPPCRR